MAISKICQIAITDLSKIASVDVSTISAILGTSLVAEDLGIGGIDEYTMLYLGDGLGDDSGSEHDVTLNGGVTYDV